MAHSSSQAFARIAPEDYGCEIYATKPSSQLVDIPTIESMVMESSPGKRNSASSGESNGRLNVISRNRSGAVYKRSDGRPKWTDILPSNGRDCALLACGPAPMVTQVERLAYDRSIAFHKEVFKF